MEKGTGKVITLGIFVIIGAILLIIGVYFIGAKKNLFSSTFKVVASFSNVDGLQDGDDVRFRGISIGTVKEVTMINDSTINLVMLFKSDKKSFIKKNAVASVETDGLLGNKIVEIRNQDGASKTIEENDILKTIPPLDMDDVKKKLKTSNDNLVEITKNLSGITDKINNGDGAMGTLISDSSVAKDLKQTMENIRIATGNLTTETEALKSNILFRKYFKKQENKK